MTKREHASDDLKSLVDLFLLNLPVEAQSVASLLHNLQDPLLELGLLRFRLDGRLELSDLILIPVLGLWLFCQRPQMNPTLYYGDDSMALLQRLCPHRGGRSLDLCSGPGVQALYSALYAAHVDAVEVNPSAAALGRLNAEMNQCQDKVSVYPSVST